jgi:hypothetical protein
MKNVLLNFHSSEWKRRVDVNPGVEHTIRRSCFMRPNPAPKPMHTQ